MGGQSRTNDLHDEKTNRKLVEKDDALTREIA